jgi:hypothetical protein
MAQFLAYTSPARGHLYPIAPTLLELARRGHDVHLRTLSSEVSPLRASGIHAEGVDPAREAIELNDWHSPEPSEGIARIFSVFARRAGYEIADLRRSITEVRPGLSDHRHHHSRRGGGRGGLGSAVGPLDSVPGTRLVQPGTFIVNRLHPLLAAAERAERGQRRACRGRSSALASPDDGWRASVELYLTAEPFELSGLNTLNRFGWSVRESGSPRRIRCPGSTR